MADFIPSSNAEFNVFQSNLLSIVQANATSWGILAADVTSLAGAQATWSPVYAKANNKQNRTSADVQARNDNRNLYEKAIRRFVAQWLACNSKVPDSERERMGITIRTAVRTPVPTPDSAPVGYVDFSTRLQHQIRIMDDTTPTSRAKPYGIYGYEVWFKLGGEVPKDSSELSFIATCTRSPFVNSFDGNDIGKTAHYWFRWINKRGERGPWSVPASAMIVG